MRMASQVLSPALTALALLLAGSGSGLAQETAGKVMMPWQKPQPKASAPSSFTDILPWLLSENGGKTQPQSGAASAWETKIDQPDEPREPTIDEWVEQGARIETGAISSTGLVLKKPLPPVPVKNDGKPQFKGAAGAEPAAAAVSPSPKIKNSIQLPGDRPVGQLDVAEVGAEASDVVAPAAAEEAPPVDPLLASPVAADEAAAPAPAEQTLHTAVPGTDGVTPVVQRADTATTPSAPAEADVVTAPASPARPVTPPVAAVAKPGKPAAAATPVAAAATPTSAAEPTQTAQAAGIPSVEPVPAMPQAEEAPPIPDALPEALVTPVAKPVATDAVQRAKELPEPVAAAAPKGMPADAAAPGLSQSKPRPPDRLMDGANVAQQYCFNIADAAKDARYAWQKKTLADIELELNKRIALLDERTAEYQKWLARRDEFIRNAEDNVVKIYAGMKVDAAAIQLALMNEESAAAVLAKLSTRNASAILNEMEPAKAAKLTMIITGAAKLKRKKEMQKPPATQGANVAPGGGPVPAQGEGGRS